MHPFDTPKLDRKLGITVVLLETSGSRCRFNNVPCVYLSSEPFKDNLCKVGWRQCERSRPVKTGVFVSVNDAALIRLRGEDNTL